MLQQLHRPNHRPHNGRGNRIRQPQIKEERKTAVPKDVVLMLDGSHCPINSFNDLRSNAHKKLKSDFNGIAQRIRLGLAQHEGAWESILDWINDHRPKYGSVGHQNDNLLALAIVYASIRCKRPVTDVINDILRKGPASVLFPATQ